MATKEIIRRVTEQSLALYREDTAGLLELLNLKFQVKRGGMSIESLQGNKNIVDIDFTSIHGQKVC